MVVGDNMSTYEITYKFINVIKRRNRGVTMPQQKLEVEMVEESIQKPSFSIADLTSEYSNLKQTASEATSKLTSVATFKGMDDINAIVAEAMSQVQEFTSNGKKSSFASSVSSKALAVIDPNNKWAGKWLGNAKDEITKESLKETTMEEVANRVIASINAQREDVISYMESVVAVRDVMAANKDKYQALLDKANELMPTIVVDTREELDTKSFINRLKKSLMQVDATITTKINPLIASAKIAIQEIDSQLPDIEHDLKYEGSLKVAQQALADLIGMAKTVKGMTEKAGDAIRKDIHETTIESIQMVGDVMIDTDRLKKLQTEEANHMQRVNKVMEDTKNKINKNYDEINHIQLEYNAAKKASNHLMLEGYANVTVTD